VGLALSLARMENEKDESTQKAAQPAKAITDLAELVHAVITALPPAKLWQRQLLTHLKEVDRLTQVLRMTVAMGRAPSEISEAARLLRVALRFARQYVVAGRADSGTKAAVLLACELGTRIDAELA
jgi:hypothetical protein